MLLHIPRVPTTIADDTLVTRADVLNATGLSATTLWREIAVGRFPKGIRISPGRLCWLRSDLQHWLDARREESRKA